MSTASKEFKALHPQKFTTRNRSRCRLCGRDHGYMRQFGLCRLCFREHAHRGELPGVTKASW